MSSDRIPIAERVNARPFHVRRLPLIVLFDTVLGQEVVEVFAQRHIREPAYSVL